MLYKAKISFTGLISMAKGEVREISDSSIVRDLLNAGYIEENTKSKPKRKRVKKDEH